MLAPITCKGSEGPASGLPMGVFALGGTLSISCGFVIAWRLRGRSLSLFSSVLFHFSASIKRGIGVPGRLTGVGGTSPVIRTNVSTQLHNIFMAASGVRVNMLMLAGSGRAPGSLTGDAATCVTPGSAEGVGGAGSGGSGASLARGCEAEDAARAS